MTPLAHHILKQLTLPLKRRCFDDVGRLLPRMGDIHCFECTEIIPLALLMAEQILEGAPIRAVSTFLPAPKTWLEFKYPQNPGVRIGYLLEERGKNTSAHITSADHLCSGTTFGLLKLDNPRLNGHLIDSSFPSSDPSAFIYAILAMINTPRIIGRQQHMPHRGLERNLVRAQKIIGKFPLNAWTEIKLEVNAPRDMNGAPSTEAHLTGQRALHFCRAHLRVRLGKVEIVRSHWRGDGSLGIKQSRYRLALPRNERSGNDHVGR